GMVVQERDPLRIVRLEHALDVLLDPVERVPEERERTGKSEIVLSNGIDDPWHEAPQGREAQFDLSEQLIVVGHGYYLLGRNGTVSSNPIPPGPAVPTMSEPTVTVATMPP